VSQPLTTGFLNDYFHSQTDIFEKTNNADFLNMPDQIMQTEREDVSMYDGLMPEEDIHPDVNLNTKQNEDGLLASQSDLVMSESVSQITISHPTISVKRSNTTLKSTMIVVELILAILCQFGCLSVAGMASTGLRAALITILAAKIVAAVAISLVIK
jgi:hypothetical protein